MYANDLVLENLLIKINEAPRKIMYYQRKKYCKAVFEVERFESLHLSPFFACTNYDKYIPVFQLICESSLQHPAIKLEISLLNAEEFWE